MSEKERADRLAIKQSVRAQRAMTAVRLRRTGSTFAQIGWALAAGKIPAFLLRQPYHYRRCSSSGYYWYTLGMRWRQQMNL